MTRLRLLTHCLFLTLAIFCSPTLTQSIIDYRLNTDVIPDFYDIRIKPYLETADGAKQFTFDGEVNITLHAIAAATVAVRNITLHTAFLNISETILYDNDDDKVVERFVGTDQLHYEEITNKLIIPLSLNLDAEKAYKLYFKYSGQIRNDLAGIYSSSYDNKNWYAMTQLHRTDARSAFPCFDEPQIKAQFRMRVTRPKECLAFFNTRIQNTVGESDGRYTDYFETTPRMSTYLVALLIASDFVVEGNNDLQLIMNEKYKTKTGFTQEVAARTMDIYDNYTQMPYKSLGITIMQMAGSNSFPHSGMENWGLIFYKDTLLAHEPHFTDGWSHKETTVSLVVHEVGHMWFGNSVTHKWWSYFWLNEAFPTYYSHYLAHEIYPEFELDKQFVLKQTQYIFELDATINTQPLSDPEETITTPDEVGHKFSNIAYDKGAAILRMMCNLMGKENYDNAIRAYLKEYHLNNTTPEDLFKHWKAHWPTDQEVDLNQLFSDWTEQPGYPIIGVTTTASGRYQLKQERFLLDPNDGSDATYLYTTPITYTTNHEKNFDDLRPKFYFNKTKTEIEFGNADNDEWLILNIQQSNYHRVYYEAKLLENIHKALQAPEHDGIHVINRAYLVDDLFTYGRIGLMGYDEVFKFMEYLSRELEYLPWQPAFKAFEMLSTRMTLMQHEQFGTFLFDILSGVYKKLGFENSKDTILDVYNRNKVITWLCRYHHEDCNQKAQRLFKSSDLTQISADFQETIYCAATRDATFDIYSSLREQFGSVPLQSQKEKILRAMGCTRHFVDFHFFFILSDEVPLELKTMAISYLYRQTPENIEPVFDNIMEYLEALANILGSWSSTATVISDLSYYFTTENQLKRLEKFINTKGELFGGSIDILENAVETVERNLAWSSKYLGSLFQYLDQRNSAASIKHSVPILSIIVIFVLSYLKF
ncbi:membrane alanyl aminopeptidase-like [Musca autumnalis]|uniref:membrane alanyl aminopeptidase-like n=1 Tax=Musca autumnalis TaxID=221902 RepID=UPI003CF3AAE7